jgi:IclR family transcriptional regulator, KDG regulon repressor
MVKASKSRPPGRSTRGLVEVSRPNGVSAKPKKPTVGAAKAKIRSSKVAARKPAPSRLSAQKARTASTATRKPGAGGTPTARKVAAKRPVSRSAPKKLVSGQQANGKASAKNSVGGLTSKQAVAKRRTAVKSAVSRTTSAKQPTSGPTRSAKPAPSRAGKTSRVRETLAQPAIDVVAREKEMAREHSTTAVNRALSLLETMARTGPVPLAVLADAAGCGKTAAFDLLTTMQTRNFVIHDETHGLWRLGARWAVLGSAASEQGALAATAMPYLAALGNATGENVYLRVREGMECETVAIYQTDPGLRVYTEVGKKMPLHAGSGRMLLAHAPEAVQTQVLAQRLQRYTPSTRTDPSWIAADLHRIRQRGFLITDSEVVAGTVSVCAAVRDSSGQVVAAILIGAPSLRMRPPRPRALMPAVVEAARKLSHALGSISEQPAPGSANGQLDARHVGAFTGSAWPTTALGATISRPHSIFR